MADNRKRRATDDSDTKEQDKRNRGPPGDRRGGPPGALPLSNVNIKLLVSNGAAGGILGRGGEKCLQLMKDYGIFMKISKFDQLYPGTQERICFISGKTVESVMKTISYIIDTMHDKDGHDKTEYKVKVVLNGTTVGSVIGKGGSNVKELKETYNVHTYFNKKDESPRAGERTLTITGKKEDIESATTLVLEKVENDDETRAFQSIDYRNSNRNSSPGRDRYGDRDGGRYADGDRDRYGGGDRYNERVGPAPFSSGGFSSGGYGDTRHGSHDNFNNRPSYNNTTTPGVADLHGPSKLDLDLKVVLPTRGCGRPLSAGVISTVLNYVDKQLINTTYSQSDLDGISDAIAFLGTRGIIELGLTEVHSQGQGDLMDQFKKHTSGLPRTR